MKMSRTRDGFRPYPTQYFGQHWRITWYMSRVGWRVWRLTKFYERRDFVGGFWRLVHHTSETQYRAIR